uniref:Reverse transcriptase domain-containing protein n=1 Tax=Fagus sylvatica TaxID=28930 RepID=A0A2N9FDK7_FAGSY
MHNKRAGKVGSMALKLDMSKAYDRVEWSFLKQVMVRMGFHDKWISLIMECISTVSYSLLINGEPTGHITPSRGLRQGDPISPYLFLLCTEGLNGLIRKATLQGNIHGVSLCLRGPKITNLFFAYDSLLFCRASILECQKIQEILATYEKASGQQLNRAKTTLFFSRNTPQATQEEIKDILGVPSIQQYEKYLGLPSLVGKEKITCFSQIKERIWSKVKGWKEKLLSQAGREVLIKAVVQAIPTYTMNCFKLPVTLCIEIEGIIRRFWWGQNKDKRKIHWLRWEKLCISKGEGGLGFRDLQKFNIALLAKQFWRLMHCRSSLFFKVFSAKFFSDVGDGTKIPIRGSNWLLDEGHRRVLSPLTNVPNDARVTELIHGSPPTWNVSKVQNLFLPYDADAILKIPLSRRVQEDKLFWFTTRDGKYSVRSGYKLLLKESRASQPESSRQWDPDPLWKKIWGARVPVKIRSFLWRACHESLPTKLGLYKRKVIPTPLCDLCQDHCEDGLHALWTCPIVKQIWESAPDFSALRTSAPTSFSELACKDRLNLPSEDYIQTWNRAQALLHEYLAVTTEEKIAKPNLSQVRWKPPQTNYYKVNFDGAIFKDSNAGGIGVVIRDNAGMVIATLSQKVRGPQTVEMIEALAARRAIIFAKEVGITDVEFEGDAVNVIRDLSSQVPIHTPYSLIIEDARAILQNLQRSSLSHTRRSGNTVAHALARRASNCNSPLIWMEEVPSDITHVLLNDFFAIN